MNRQSWFVVALLLAGLAAGIAAQMYIRSSADGAILAGTRLPEPLPLPDFRLEQSGNALFERNDLTERWTLLFFGFVNCPDVCPTTLARLATTVEHIAASGDPVPQVVFISIDPARDTPEDAAAYARHFNVAFEAATGDDEALRVLTRPLGILHTSVNTGPDAYTVDHSSAILLIDPEARLAAVFGAPHDPAAIAADFRTLAETG